MPAFSLQKTLSPQALPSCGHAKPRTPVRVTDMKQSLCTLRSYCYNPFLGAVAIVRKSVQQDTALNIEPDSPTVAPLKRALNGLELLWACNFSYILLVEKGPSISSDAVLSRLFLVYFFHEALSCVNNVLMPEVLFLLVSMTDKFLERLDFLGSANRKPPF